MKFCNIFSNLGKLLIVNFLFLVFNNSQLSIILTFTNKKYPNDDYLTNGIGIINTYMNLLVYPFLLGVASSFEILGSQTYGSSDFNLFNDIHKKIKFIGRIFLIVIFILSYIFNEWIIHLWNFDVKVVNIAVKILLIRLISMFFEFETFIQLRYIQIINCSRQALILIILNGFSLPIVCFIFINLLNFHALGCGFSYLTSNVLFMISLKLYIHCFCFNEVSLEIQMKNSNKEVDKSLKDTKIEETDLKNDMNQIDDNHQSIEITTLSKNLFKNMIHVNSFVIYFLFFL